MIQAKCIQKFKDKAGRVIRYKLIDLNNNSLEIQACQLKKLIKNNQINVINLKLTSDNRLIDYSEKVDKQLDKQLIKNFGVPKASKFAVALANLYILYNLDANTDTLQGTVSELCYNAKINFNSNADYIEQVALAFEKLLNNNQKYVEYIMNMISNDSDIYKYAIFKEGFDSDTINKSKIYNYLATLSEYSTQYKMKSTIQSRYKHILKDLRYNLNYGYSIGIQYFRYLDESLFGTVMNDRLTVGCKFNELSKSVIDELYSKKIGKDCYYIIHKNINILGAPRTPFEVIFRKVDGRSDIASIYLAREAYSSNNTVYNQPVLVKLTEISFNRMDSLDKNAKKLAFVLNSLVHYVYEIANRYPSLYNTKSLNESLEKIDRNEVADELSQSEIITIMANRITAITGEHKKAVIADKKYDISLDTISAEFENRIGDADFENYKLVIKVNDSAKSVLLAVSTRDTEKMVYHELEYYDKTLFDIAIAKATEAMINQIQAL